jgi:hypothetical protein
MREWDDKQQKMVGYCYLCNEAFEADYRKTNIMPRKVNCRNCKQIIKKFKLWHHEEDITLYKLLVD